MSDAPYIHIFRTSEQCYVYDVNTDKILKIPEAVHDYLSNSCSSDVDGATLAFVQNMKRNGFLRSDRVEISEHPATPLLPFYLENKMYQLILQVTQRCNLRCSYCTYSGSYKTRTHSDSSMSVETAERAIDFFIKRTKDNKHIAISFYGGEPLLNLELIKHCVRYVNTKYYGKEIDYAITTNGTLLNDDSITFFADNGFQMLISLDGPKEIHDARRRFASNGEGSFSIIMNNIANMKRLRMDYYQANVRFNTVLDTAHGFNRVNEFVSGEEICDVDKFMFNYISDRYTDQKSNVNEEFFADREYEFFKLLLSKLGEISQPKTSSLIAIRFLEIYTRCNQSIGIEQTRIPSKFHHSGPCVPGVLRLFVDINGNFFPCERVSELSQTVLLGNIEQGISFEKVSEIMNPEIMTQSRCRNCWAYRQCSVCVAMADDMHNLSDAETEKKCPLIRDMIDDIFKDFCVLKELGYNFDEERISMV